MNPTWRQRSACRGLDPDVFVPSSDEEAEEAKAVCATCPVRQLCLEHALAHREYDGIWGGFTEARTPPHGAPAPQVRLIRDPTRRARHDRTLRDSP